MKQTVTEYDFIDAFDKCGRGNNFTVAGRRALFEYLEDYEQSCGEELELDPIAVCCDFDEYDTAIDCIHDAGYGFEPDEDDDPETQEEAALEWLRDQTTVIEFSCGIIIHSF